VDKKREVNTVPNKSDIWCQCCGRVLQGNKIITKMNGIGPACDDECYLRLLDRSTEERGRKAPDMIPISHFIDP